MTETSYAERARAEKTAKAAAMGIDDALISRLVEQFYGSIRRDEILGPIFEKNVTDWPVHLSRMKDFWASVTLESGRFRGNPMRKHIAIGKLEQSHFDRWMAMWNETLDEIVSGQEAAAVFREAAGRIASSLLTGIMVQRGGLDAVSSKKEK